MEKVELHDGYFFTCPECGRDVLVYAAVMEDGSLPEEERKEMLAEAGIGDEAEGEFISIPETVRCKDCDKEFAVDFDDESELEDWQG